MFSNCGIEKIEIPNTVEKIGNYSFYGTAIQEITIPSSVKRMGDYIFDSCSHLAARPPRSAYAAPRGGRGKACGGIPVAGGMSPKSPPAPPRPAPG